MTEDTQYDAVLLDVEKDLSNSFNAVLGATIAVCIVFLIIAANSGNSLSSNMNDSDAVGEYIPVWERYTQDYETNTDNGSILERGTYKLLETANQWNSTHHFVEYDIPIEEGGAAPNGLISLAVWLPDAVEEGIKVPVIAESGPYFQEPSVQTDSIEVPGSWLVP